MSTRTIRRLGLVAFFALATHAIASPPVSPEAADIRATVKAYHRALESGDRDAAIAMLADDLQVLESGWIETRKEYLSHHLDSDMEFAAATIGTHRIVQAIADGDVGWVISESTAKGTFREHDINTVGAELMVLGKIGDTWKIRAIHWSSRKLKE